VFDGCFSARSSLQASVGKAACFSVCAPRLRPSAVEARFRGGRARYPRVFHGCLQRHSLPASADGVCQRSVFAVARVHLRRFAGVVQPSAEGYSWWHQPPRLARFFAQARTQAPACLTRQQPMQQVSIAPALRRWQSSPALPWLSAVRSVLSSPTRRWPNHSVKGTSCAYAQAAPYLER